MRSISTSPNCVRRPSVSSRRAFHLHVWFPDGEEGGHLVTHQVPIGDFDGPHPFFGAGWEVALRLMEPARCAAIQAAIDQLLALTGFRRSFLRARSRRDTSAEALFITIRPLEVIHQAPVEIPLYGDAFRRRALQMREIVPEIHDAVEVVDLAVTGRPVGGRCTVLADIDLLDVPDLARHCAAPNTALPARSAASLNPCAGTRSGTAPARSRFDRHSLPHNIAACRR